MPININCTSFFQPWNCTNTKVKRSWFGFGPRHCTEYPRASAEGCAYQTEHIRPPSAFPLPPPPPKKNNSKCNCARCKCKQVKGEHHAS